jgi:serine/threonine protein kinase
MPAAQGQGLANHLEQCDKCRHGATELRQNEELMQRLRRAMKLDGGAAIREQIQARVAGDYEVLEALGQGANGVVFQARDVHLDRFVAIKCATNAVERERLLSLFKEARILATINHPNVAAVYTLSERPDPPLMVMEFVDGPPIDQALADAPLEQKLSVFRQVLKGVADLHRRGIVHRDLKPGNILVTRAGQAKVLDLGIAERAWDDAESLAVRGGPQGTPTYLAPEQSRGEAATPATDIFSLGIILFELLTGQPPFQGESIADLVQAIRQSDPPLPRSLNSAIPGPLQAICLTALEKVPARRYASAQQFLQDLERFVRGEPIIANPTVLASILEHGIDQHLGDLQRWQENRLISSRESDYFAERYQRLRQREEFWVLDSRRISFSQVALHLGAWTCVISAFLMVGLQWPQLNEMARISLPLGIFAALLSLGLALWKRHTYRVSLVLLMAACLTWPLLLATLFITMKWGLLVSPDDFLGQITNFEAVVVAGTWLAVTAGLWRHTKTSAFALIWGLSALVFATTLFALAGMKHWKNDEVAAWYMLPGAALFGLAMLLDLRWRRDYFAAPLYIMGFIVLAVALSELAYRGPTTKWLGVAGEVPHQIEYSFIINGLLALAFGLLADRSEKSWWLRRTATVLFWLAPSHILLPIRLLANEWPLLPYGWTIPEVLLPLGAMIFVFASVPTQMKSFFFSGLGYLAVALQRITAEHFDKVFAWPVTLSVMGLTLAIIAWRRPTLFDKPKRKHVAPGVLREADAPDVSQSTTPGPK